jgi:hypothetical protein
MPKNRAQVICSALQDAIAWQEQYRAAQFPFLTATGTEWGDRAMKEHLSKLKGCDAAIAAYKAELETILGRGRL